MSDTDVSVEAAVAGTAAAAAVEEVHAREEVVDLAVGATVTADEASMEAASANETAAFAGGQALEASAAAAEAQQTAEEAQQTTAEVGYATADLFESYRAENDAKLREMREYIDAHVPLPAPEAPAFEEVEANDGTSVSDSSAGSDGDEAEAGESSGGAQKSSRYGLRHRRR